MGGSRTARAGADVRFFVGALLEGTGEGYMETVGSASTWTSTSLSSPSSLLLTIVAWTISSSSTSSLLSFWLVEVASSSFLTALETMCFASVDGTLSSVVGLGMRKDSLILILAGTACDDSFIGTSSCCSSLLDASLSESDESLEEVELPLNDWSTWSWDAMARTDSFV
jgi:hypothetical protein